MIGGLGWNLDMANSLLVGVTYRTANDFVDHGIICP